MDIVGVFFLIIYLFIFFFIYKSFIFQNVLPNVLKAEAVEQKGEIARIVFFLTLFFY